MRLSALIDDEIGQPAGHGDPEITGLSADSRRVAPGNLFAALAGAKADGARFAGEAVAKGAAAVLVDASAGVPELGVPVVRAREPRRALALMAARFSGGQPAIALAVTGTSGKTSVAEFTRQILAALGRRAASLGTIGVVKPDGAIYGSLTTPDPITLHAMLAELAREGVSHLAFEASSHGLDQHRLDGVRLTAAAFTNLGRDHMDYHPTVEHYLAAKLRLFRELLQPGQTAVVNSDGAMSAAAIEAARQRGLALLTVGGGGETLCLEGARRDGFAQRLKIRHGTEIHEVRLPLIGAYQVENALVAAGLAIAAGEEPARSIAALERLTGVSGRLDMVGEVRGGLVLVDYAHKPEALIAALAACRPFATGKLVCVLGCGGDRDRGKRPIMGAIAAEAADRVVVTDDNPRTERPEAIRAEILAGVPADARSKVREIGDRHEAIHTAIAAIGPGDVVLIAGKGHETGQIIGDVVLPFSDHEVARSEIQREMGHG